MDVIVAKNNYLIFIENCSFFQLNVRKFDFFFIKCLRRRSKYFPHLRIIQNIN